MSTFHFVKSSISSPLPSSSSLKSSLLSSKFAFFISGNGLYNRFQSKKLKLGTSCTNRRLPRTACKISDNENRSNGEEAPESLFMKELKRRGMTPTSLLEETKSEEEEGPSQPRPEAVPKNAVLNQREQSMALNSEGLEGLIPRAKQLLTLGGTFFLAFGPLILFTVAFFLVLYLVTFASLISSYFGPTFVHDGSVSRTSIPQYIDPYQLLEEERINRPVNLKL